MPRRAGDVHQTHVYEVSHEQGLAAADVCVAVCHAVAVRFTAWQDQWTRFLHPWFFWVL
jgi:hypothetical protein